MIEPEKIKRMVKRINEWEYEEDTPFTVLPPSYGEPYLLRVYGCGGLLSRIRYDMFSRRAADIYMMDKNYPGYLDADKEKNDLKNFLENATGDSDYSVKLFGGEKDGEIDNQFMQLAVKAMKKKWIKTTQKPKEKDIQAAIVSNFMKNHTNWKVIAQEVQYEKEWFQEGNFDDSERFDLIVMSERGLGFVELKVDNKNYENLDSHYEHMQFVKQHPDKFVGEIDRRFDLIKEYSLWQEDEFEKYNNKKIWFGFLFVNGGYEKSKSLVEKYFQDKQHNSDETYYMYYEGDIEKLDINNMMDYENFMAHESA